MIDVFKSRQSGRRLLADDKAHTHAILGVSGEPTFCRLDICIEWTPNDSTVCCCCYLDNGLV